jgi:glycosyltransferase involved in cell wall biosynthesis
VLHDAVLHHLYADVLLARGRAASYLREVGYGRAAAVSRAAEAVLGEAAPAWYDEPLIARAIDLSRVTIVHSRAAAAAVLRARPRARVRLVHHGVAAPRFCGPPTEAPFTVGTFGGIDLQKRIPSVLRALDALRADVPDARLLLVGAVAPGVDLPERPGLEVLGRVTLEQMETLMARCHVCVQLRWPTAGEASGAALRALRLGRPLVVSDCGWFAELPPAVADRIPAGSDTDAESAALARALLALARDPGRREQMTAAALDLAAAWSWDAAAARYVEAISEACRR